MAETSETERIRILMEFDAEQAEKNAKRMERAVEGIERRFDPLARATQRYNTEQKKLNLALNAGVITADRHAAAMAKVEKEYQDVQRAAGQATQIIAANGAAVNNLTGFVGRNRAGFQQLGYQVGDFAVQVQGGTSAVTAFTQQGSQLLGVFGPLGAILGAALAVFVPLTAGILASGEASDEAKTRAKAYQEAISALTQATNSYAAAVSAAATPLDELQERYGRLTEAARAALTAQVEVEQARSVAALAAAVDTLTGQYGRLFTEEERLAAGALRSGGAGAQARATIESFQSELDLSAEAADRLYTALVALDQANGVEASAIAAADLVAMLDAAYGSALQMPAPLLDAYDAASRIVAEAARLSAITDEASGAAFSLSDAFGLVSDAIVSGVSALDQMRAAAPGEGWLSAAISQAAALAGNLWDAAAVAQAAASGAAYDAELGATGQSSGPDAARSRINGGGRFTPRVRGAGLARAAQGRGASSGGGRGGGGANDVLRERDRILEGLKSKEEKHNEDLAEAESLYKSGALTIDQYNQQISKLEETYNKTQMDQLEKGVKQIADTFADAIVNGENLGEAFGNLLKKMAADLLSSGIQTLIQNALFPSAPAGRSGVGGVFGRLLGGLFGGSGVRSFDGGGYTGSGARVGGLDGKGGMPALIHPRETVIDHTKGPSLAQMAGQAREVAVRVLGGDLMLGDGGQIMARVRVVAEQTSRAGLQQVPTIMADYEKRNR